MLNVDVPQRNSASDAFERMVELPMLILALAMVPVLVIPELIDLSPAFSEGFFVAEWFIWSVFALELTVRTYLAEHRARYLRQHWFDVIIVVVPFLRPLRLARSARLLRLARGGRAFAVAMRLSSTARLLLDTNGIKYAVVGGGVLFVASAVLALLFERHGGGNITTLDDAIWWASVTITTVGYGDHFPVTTEGRAIAVFLMFLGISLFSLITASVAALFVRPAAERQNVTLEDVLVRLEEMEQRLITMQLEQRDREAVPMSEDGREEGASSVDRQAGGVGRS